MQEKFTYIKNKEGEIKSVFFVSDKPDLVKMRQLSTSFRYIIYSIPVGTEVEFNDDGWLIGAQGNEKNIWQFLNGWAMPFECFVNGFPFPLKMGEIWKSDKKVEEIATEELVWNLKYPWWNTDNNSYYNLKPEDFVSDVNKYPYHKEKMDNADDKYPLLLVKTKQNRWLIYDGVHRFVKQILKGKEKVLCQKFTFDEIKEYLPEEYTKLFEEWLDLEYVNI